MYMPEDVMTVELVAEVVASFDWPAPYVVEDELPDGVVVAFANCCLFFAAGFEGAVSIKFLAQDTGLEASLTLAQALLALGPAPAGTDLQLINDVSPRASLQKVRSGLHDECAIVLARDLCLDADLVARVGRYSLLAVAANRREVEFGDPGRWS
jgi:hypothetical protein